MDFNTEESIRRIEWAKANWKLLFFYLPIGHENFVRQRILREVIQESARVIRDQIDHKEPLCDALCAIIYGDWHKMPKSFRGLRAAIKRKRDNDVSQKAKWRKRAADMMSPDGHTLYYCGNCNLNRFVNNSIETVADITCAQCGSKEFSTPSVSESK